MALPTVPQTRSERDPLGLRFLLAGAPKSGKTTLASGWAPSTTLLIDTQHGTDMLHGEHMVQHVATWDAFVATVKELVRGGHNFKTVQIDMIDDIWRWCDVHHAPRGKAAASAANDYQASIRQAEMAFYTVLGKLLGTDMGVWFATHTATRLIDGEEQDFPKLDKRVYGWVSGACDIIAIAEGKRRVLHTQPTSRFDAGSRLDLASPLALDAKALYGACKAALMPVGPSMSTPGPVAPSATQAPSNDQEPTS